MHRHEARWQDRSTFKHSSRAISMSEQPPPLKEYIPKLGPVTFITSAKQVDKTKDHVILVGSAYCPHCQDGVPQFNAACGDLKTAKGDKNMCFLIDVTDQKSAKVMKELGLKPEGVPSHFFWNAEEEKYEVVVGKRKAPEMKKIMKEHGLLINE